jgi:hypothetical protein
MCITPTPGHNSKTKNRTTQDWAHSSHKIIFSLITSFCCIHRLFANRVSQLLPPFLSEHVFCKTLVVLQCLPLKSQLFCKMNLSPALLFAFGSLPIAAAWPNGAGRCIPAEAAVSGSHLSRATVRTGSLEEAGYSVAFHGKVLAADGTIAKYFGLGETHPLEITGSTTTFKGFLMRLGAPDGSTVSTVDALNGVDGDSSVQVASVCTDGEGVGGVTHTNNDDKTAMAATIFMTEAVEGLTLDVTVVGENSGSVSSYYFSRYLITAGSDPYAATMSPAMSMDTMSPAMSMDTMSPAMSMDTMAPAMSMDTMAPSGMSMDTTAPSAMSMDTMAPTSTENATTSMAPATTASPTTAAPTAPASGAVVGVTAKNLWIATGTVLATMLLVVL